MPAEITPRRYGDRKEHPTTPTERGAVAKARKSRTLTTAPPTPEETSVVELRLRGHERVITTVEGSGPPEQYDFYGGSFRQISALLGAIAVETDLSKRACHMLLVLCGAQERGGAIKLKQDEMGKLMASERRPKGWSRIEVNQVLKELREAGLFLKIGRGHYAFDPQVAFHGTATEQQAALDRMPEFPKLQVSETTWGGPNE